MLMPGCVVSCSHTTCQVMAVRCSRFLSDIQVILSEYWPFLIGKQLQCDANHLGHVHTAIPSEQCCGTREEPNDTCTTTRPKCLAIALVCLWVCSSYEIFLRSLYPLNSSLGVLTTSFYAVFCTFYWCVLAAWARGRVEEEQGLHSVCCGDSVSGNRNSH